MKIQQKIIAVVLLLIVSIVVGCAQKLTEEQALAESHAISDFIYNSSVAYQKSFQQSLQKIKQRHNRPLPSTIKPISLPPIKKVGNHTKRLVLLSPNESLRWLRANGLKINIMRFNMTKYRITISDKNGNSKRKMSSIRPRKFSKVDNPIYLQIGNSKIRMAGFQRWNEDVIWINDQYDKIRVLTYE